MTEQLETQLDTERRTDGINLSPVAASKVKSLLEQEGRDDLALRISVQPGGSRTRSSCTWTEWAGSDKQEALTGR